MKVTGVTRLRVGIGLWLFAWFPLAGLTLIVIEATGNSPEHPGSLFGAIAIFQYCVGLVALVLAGAETVKVIKVAGARKAPEVIWRMLRYGKVPEQPKPTTEQSDEGTAGTESGAGTEGGAGTDSGAATEGTESTDPRPR